ncbi:MAG TPA: CAP domain-containing protein [Blastocatellia bacterium]|nr:CAP domain-containing protein [Blastocatellia bacterium]
MKFRTMISVRYIFPCVLFLFVSSLSLAQTPTLDAEEQAFLNLINEYRVANGLSTLQVSVTLTNAADWLSNDMANKGYFSHTDSSGRDPFTRMKAFGYTQNTWMGENIAAGYSDAANAFNQWKNSPSHNEVMLQPNFKAIGIGRVVNLGAYYRYYWTTDFGGVVDAVLPINISPVSTVNAASYTADLAPESIASAFGNGMATGIHSAANIPLPKSLGGTTMTVNGIAAELLYVSPTQINFVLPNNLSPGSASLEVTLNGTVVGKGAVTVSNVAPGLFTFTSDGRGVPAGYSTFDGKTLTPIYNPNGTARLLEASTAQRPNYLVLFGTGLRRRSSLSNVQVRIGGILCQVDYAAAQGYYVGLDQLNLIVPTAARGSGEVNLVLTVDGKQANTVRVNVGN